MAFRNATTPIIVHRVHWCLPTPIEDFCSCDQVCLGSQSLKYFFSSVPLQKQITTPKLCKLFKLPNLIPLSHNLHQLSTKSNNYICKSIWISIVLARGRIDLDTILILMGASSLPLQIQRPFSHLCSLCLSIGSANLILLTFCCRLPCSPHQTTLGRDEIVSVDSGHCVSLYFESHVFLFSWKNKCIRLIWFQENPTASSISKGLTVSCNKPMDRKIRWVVCVSVIKDPDIFCISMKPTLERGFNPQNCKMIALPDTHWEESKWNKGPSQWVYLSYETFVEAPTRGFRSFLSLSRITYLPLIM